jgi:hypothetical protein
LTILTFVEKVNHPREAMMAKRSGMFKSDKRKKELSRKKKQEEKRLKRQKDKETPLDSENPESVNGETESSSDSPEGPEQEVTEGTG